MSVATQTSLGKLLAFLDSLEEKRVAYTLAHVRDTIMVCINVPGERWEVEFFENGEIEIERYISQGVDEIGDEKLAQLITEYSD